MLFQAQCQRLESLVHIVPYSVLRTLYCNEVPAASFGMDQSQPSQKKGSLFDSGSSSSAESDCSSGCDSSGSSSDH